MQDNPCGWCHCDMRDEIPVFDFRTNAEWRKTCYSPEQMAAKYEHPVFKVPGLNSEAIFLDVMHTVDLGVSMHVAGSVLWDLIEDEMTASNRPSRCVQVNRLLVECYNELGTPASQRVGVLKLTDIGESVKEFPVLKHCKARKVRYLVPVIKMPLVSETQRWLESHN